MKFERMNFISLFIIFFIPMATYSQIKNITCVDILRVNNDAGTVQSIGINKNLTKQQLNSYPSAVEMDLNCLTPDWGTADITFEPSSKVFFEFDSFQHCDRYEAMIWKLRVGYWKPKGYKGDVVKVHRLLLRESELVLEPGSCNTLVR